MNERNRDRWVTLRIVAIYALIGASWIYLSDTILGWIVRDPDVMVRINLFKGLLYIALTAALLYVLFQRHLLRIRKVEGAIRESEDRYRRLFELESDAIVLVDSQSGRILEANAAATRLYGYSHDEWLAMIHTDISAEPERTREAIQENRAHIPIRWHRKKGGELFPVEISGSPFEWRGRAVYVAAIRDITDRMRSEEALRESEARYRALIELTPDAIFIQREGKFDYLNAAAVRLFGATSPEQLLGRPVLEFVHPDYRDIVARRMQDVREQDKTAPLIEEQYLSVDGVVIDVEVAAIPFVYDGRPAAQVVARDITARKRAERERQQLEAQVQQTQKLESLGVLAGGIAHDFNNLLMGILGNADLALHELPESSPASPSVENIVEAARRAADLCSQMLAYSGRGRFETKRIDLSKVVSEMTHMLEVSVSKRADLRYDLADDLPPVEADPTQVRQVIMNLITNASESLVDRDGIISFRTSKMECSREYLRATYLGEGLAPGVYVCLEVEDTGCGMDEGSQKRIFEPFFTTKFTGRGLGLAAVLGIIRAHKGSLNVVSKPDQGTKFTVLFPSVTGTVAAESPPAGNAEPHEGKGRVLLVDDDASVRNVAARMLRRLGYEVLTADDGAAALGAFQGHESEFQCVLLDLTMPRMNGEECFQELRRMRPDLPIVLSSGFSEQEIAGRFPDLTAVGFIQKPYRMEQLGGILNKLL